MRIGKIVTIQSVTILSLGDWGRRLLSSSMGEKFASGGFAIPDSSVRRQNMTTWGMLALAVFVAVGMAEWSKRTAADEKVISSEVMEEALKIAAARDSGVKGLRDSESGKRKAESEKRISKIGNEAATTQTSAGAER